MASKPYEKVETKVAALLRIEELIDGGMKTTEAVSQVAARFNISVRSLYDYRRLTNFVPRADWGKVIAPRWNPTTGIRSQCHPEALDRFICLCRSGLGIAESYRRMAAEAEQNSWHPVAPERTLRRELDRQVSKSDLRKVRRDASSGAAV